MLHQVYLGNLPEIIEVILPLVLAAVWMRVGVFSPAREANRPPDGLPRGGHRPGRKALDG